MQKNVASQKLTVFAFDSTTNLPKTGDAANITAYYDLDDAGVTVLTDTSATECDATNAKGFYIFDLAQAETNGNKIMFSAKSTTSNIVVIGAPAVVFTDPVNYTKAVIDTNGLIDGNMVKSGPTGSGTAQTARDIGGALPATAAGASNGLIINGTNSGTVQLAVLVIAGTTTFTGTTSFAAVTTSGTVTLSALTVTNGTTFTGTVQTGNWTSNSLTVTNGTTFTGAIAATNGSNSILGVGAYVLGFLTTAITETVPGYISAALKKFFNVATPTATADTMATLANQATVIANQTTLAGTWTIVNENPVFTALALANGPSGGGGGGNTNLQSTIIWTQGTTL